MCAQAHKDEEGEHMRFLTLSSGNFRRILTLAHHCNHVSTLLATTIPNSVQHTAHMCAAPTTTPAAQLSDGEKLCALCKNLI